jgi:hypothetical protein
MKRASRVFRFSDIAIRVITSRTDDMRWLEEFVSPALRPGVRGPVDATIHHVVDRDRWEEIRAGGPTPHHARVECFFLDTQVVRYPLWRSSRGETVVRDEEFDVFYVVNRRTRTVEIVADGRDRVARLSLMRVLREIASSIGHRPRRLVTHGAAVRVGSRGVVIAGNKNSGKTTLLMHALRQRDAAYLSNDRVLIDPTPTTPRVFGIPTIVSVRYGTLRQFPAVAKRLRARAYRPALRLSECSRIATRSAPWRGRYTMSPRQLRALFRVSASDSIPLTAFLLPRVTKERGTIEFSPLSPTRAARAVRNSLFRAGSARKAGGLFNWFGRDGGASSIAIERACERVATHVPCYIAHLGRDAYRLPSTWADAWDEIE